jgi:putative ABC transport system ATP-binding protein
VENVALPLFYQGVSRKKRNALALEYLDKLGLKDWAHHMPNEMSGGQKQRVAIARALITQPQIILADEPTGALDSKTSVEVMQILKDLHKTGMTIVVVTHESGVAIKLFISRTESSNGLRRTSIMMHLLSANTE